MTFKEIVELTEGKIILDKGNVHDEIKIGCSSDLMSDILTLEAKENAVLVTGLANIQAIRTAHMADLGHILFVREKQITNEMIEVAEDLEISLAVTCRPMFTVCGKLYQAGLIAPY